MTSALDRRSRKRGTPSGTYRCCVKPLLDRVLAAVLLLLAAPLMLVILVVLAVSQRGQVLFVQPRAGHQGRIFPLLKFKTMAELRDSSGELLPDEQRTTRVGHWLRRTSLDELPQLVNVLGGQLSLIGPRPLLPEYLPHYDAQQARRHEVRPGITGWAQVNGRNALSWQQRFALDVWYVDHLSWRLDVQIAARTLLCVLRREGVDASGGVAMPKFTGSSLPPEIAPIETAAQGPCRG